MVAPLSVLSLFLLVPAVVLVLLRYIDNAEEIEKREMQKLISEALRS